MATNDPIWRITTAKSTLDADDDDMSEGGEWVRSRSSRSEAKQAALMRECTADAAAVIAARDAGGVERGELFMFS